MSSSKQIDLQRTLRQSVKTGDTVSHFGIFDPALWTVAPLTFFLVHLSPLSGVNKYIVQCIHVLYSVQEGVWGSGPQKDKHLQQSPLTGQIFWHIALPSMSLIFLRLWRKYSEYKIWHRKRNKMNAREYTDNFCSFHLVMARTPGHRMRQFKTQPE